MKKIIKISLTFCLLLSSSFAQSTIMVNFSGIIDPAHPGLYSAGDTFSGSFEIDETVVAAGGVFSGAVDNFELDIAGDSFTGGNGSLSQHTNINTNKDYIVAVIGVSGSFGTVSGTTSGGQDIHAVALGWEAPLGNLFSDPSILVSDLDSSSFNFLNPSEIQFNGGGVFSQAMITQTTFGSASPVPVPAAVWFFVSGIISLFGFSRRK